MKKIYFSIILFLFFFNSSKAQTLGDFRTITTGDWQDKNIWERYNGSVWQAASNAPDFNAGKISISPSTIATCFVPITVDQLEINKDGRLNLLANMTLNNAVGTDLIIAGSLSWIDGDIKGTGNISNELGGFFNITTPINSFNYLSCNISNKGDLNWTGGNILFRNPGAQVQIENIGTMNVATNGTSVTLGEESGPIATTGSLKNIGVLNILPETGFNFNLYVLDFTSNGTINLTGLLNLDYYLPNTPSQFNNNDGLINFNSTNSALYINNTTFNYNNSNYIDTMPDINGQGLIVNNGTIFVKFNLILPAGIELRNYNLVTGSSINIFSDIHLTGKFLGAGPLRLYGNADWETTATSGIISYAITVGGSGNLTILNNVNVGGIWLIIAGTLNWQNGDINFTHAGTGLVGTNNGPRLLLNLHGTLNANHSNNQKIKVISSNPANKLQFSILTGGKIIKNGTSITEIYSEEFLMISNSPLITPITNSALQGNGIIKFICPTFLNNGHISPGLSPGILELQGGLPLSSLSTINIEMKDGSGAPTGQDLLEINGNLALNGNLIVTEIGTVPNGGYKIINATNGVLTGTFTNVTLPAGYSIIYNPTNVVVTKILNPLPINLISFSCKNIIYGNELNWETTSEVNNAYFEIEKSTNKALKFNKIGQVAGANNSNEKLVYRFLDESPNSENFYRLKQIDLDGKFTFSKIISVKNESKTEFAVFPNPVIDNLEIQNNTSEVVDIQLFDSQGNLISSKNKEIGDKINLTMGNLPKGIYLIKMKNEKQSFSQKIVKQ
jgi:hypothetical protein